MRRFFLGFLIVAAASAAVVGFVPEARQRFESATGIKVPFGSGAQQAQAPAKKKGGPQVVPVTAAIVTKPTCR